MPENFNEKKQEAKRCTKCKIIKTLDEFYNVTKNPDGKSYNCKDCTNTQQKAGRERRSKIAPSATPPNVPRGVPTTILLPPIASKYILRLIRGETPHIVEYEVQIVGAQSLYIEEILAYPEMVEAMGLYKGGEEVWFEKFTHLPKIVKTDNANSKDDSTNGHAAHPVIGSHYKQRGQS